MNNEELFQKFLELNEKTGIIHNYNVGNIQRYRFNGFPENYTKNEVRFGLAFRKFRIAYKNQVFKINIKQNIGQIKAELSRVKIDFNIQSQEIDSLEQRLGEITYKMEFSQ